VLQAINKQTNKQLAKEKHIQCTCITLAILCRNCFRGSTCSLAENTPKAELAI